MDNNTYVNENKVARIEATTGQKIFNFFSRFGMFFVAIILAVIFAVASPQFITGTNLLDILRTACVYGIAAMGVSLVQIAGEIDFACGAELTFGACLLMVLTGEFGMNYWLACLIAILACAACGFINWVFHSFIGIPAFIATMGTSLILEGVTKKFTGGVRYFSSKWPSIFTFLGQGKIGGVIPVPAIILVVIALIMLYYTEGTNNGKKLYAVGNNAKTCRYVGIDERREKIKTFIICGALCAVAGIINASMARGGDYKMGASTLINCLTINMLGATFYRTGSINVPGTILGAVIISMLDNGKTMAGASTGSKYIIKGVVLLGAVLLVNVIRARSIKKS